MDIANLSIEDAVFRVVDLETTGLEPETDRVCEIAWRDVLACGEELTLIPQTTLINLGIPIPARASAVHHLVDADVTDAPELAKILPKFCEPISDGAGDLDVSPVFVAHNAAFERSFLGVDGPWLCTYRLSLHLWPELESHSNQFLRYALDLSPDISRDTPAHRAAADVAVTLQILLAGLKAARTKWPDVSTVGALIDRVERPALLHRVPFKSSGHIPFEEATEDHLEWIVMRGAGGRGCVYTASHWLERRQRERIVSIGDEIPF